MAFAEPPSRRGSYPYPLPPDHRNTNARGDRDVDPHPLAPTSQRNTERQQDHCAPRYEEPSGDTLISTNVCPDFQTAPLADPVAPRLPGPSSSPLRRPATVSPASANSRRDEFVTCQLDEPGCYVLVPTSGQNSDESTRTTEARYYREKKINPSKKVFRKPMDETERQAIKFNRKVGVCLRCKLFKEKVSRVQREMRSRVAEQDSNTARDRSAEVEYPANGAAL
jgi:hypothetical protein